MVGSLDQQVLNSVRLTTVVRVYYKGDYNLPRIHQIRYPLPAKGLGGDMDRKNRQRKREKTKMNSLRPDDENA